jgi:DNA-binding PadR family transcriptional regulator
VRDDEVRDLLPLPAAALYILTVLSRGPAHGYVLMSEIRELSGGSVRLGPGTLYGSIKRMVGQGLIQESAERPDAPDDDERRRYYEITELGRSVGAAEHARLVDLLAATDGGAQWRAEVRPVT